MENESLFLSNYSKIRLKEDKDDPFRRADVQRRCLIQMFGFSNKSLDNLNSCELLDKNLQEYSKILFPDGTSIYDTQLQNLISLPNKKKFKSNLDKIDIDSFVKKLPCSQDNAFCCKESETPSETELTEFAKAFNRKLNSQSIPTTSRNFESNKHFQRSCGSEINYPESKSHTITSGNFFKTAREELEVQSVKKNNYGNVNNYSAQPSSSFPNVGGQKRKLGSRRHVNSKFVSPLQTNPGSNEEIKSDEWPTDQIVDERLKNIEPKMVELIKSEIMDCGPNIHWDDIAGLEYAKTTIQEVVVWPMLRPDIFTGLRRPPKGILLFGPPGTGKTLIGKCVASQSKSTFFSISASSLTSKWIGESEKMVRALFCVARVHQPSVIFIDEIDSLLSQRNETEHESSRRIKTEFLVQLEGATTDSEERILVIGATNRPQELDEAARRRFVKRLYVPLPEYQARLQLVKKLISSEKHFLKEEDFEKIATTSEGYSGADIRNLCAEASLGPIRSIDMRLIQKIQAGEVRPLKIEDFDKAFTRVRPSVSPKDLDQYIAWDKTYGSGGAF